MARATRCKIVAYHRTSKGDQLLGIDAQQTTVRRIAEDRGCTIVRTCVEHESGGDNDRQELDKAIRHARRAGAALVVAKLDRLARDARFLMKLYDGNVPILFGDLPEIDGSAASRFMIQVMASMAEFERRRISERTREAMSVGYPEILRKMMASNSQWAQCSPTSCRILRKETGSDPGGQHGVKYRIQGLSVG